MKFRSLEDFMRQFSWQIMIDFCFVSALLLDFQGSQTPTLETARLESQRIFSNVSSITNTGDKQPSVTTPVTVAMAPPRMTDLLLLGSGVTDVTKRPAARSVDEFRSEIPSLKKKPKTRRKQSQLPKKFEYQMGQANLCCAHGEYEKAKNICMEIIRQGKYFCLIIITPLVPAILLASHFSQYIPCTKYNI